MHYVKQAGRRENNGWEWVEDQRYNKQGQPNCTAGRNDSSQTHRRSLVHEEVSLGINGKGGVEVEEDVIGREKQETREGN
jgi:hypothetical protein